MERRNAISLWIAIVALAIVAAVAYAHRPKGNGTATATSTVSSNPGNAEPTTIASPTGGTGSVTPESTPQP